MSARDLADRSHSYRNFEPEEFVAALEQSSQSEVRGALSRVESGRFEPLLAKTSAFFAALDRDEMETFTRRNPGLIRWMSVWNRLNDYNPYSDWDELAHDLLMQGEWDVPPFERTALRRDTLLQDLSTRRRSYRNFTPGEFMELAEERNAYEISEGQAREVGLYTAEVREDIDDWPLENVDGKLLARELFPRIESGRFEPVLRAAHKFFAPLDPDEGRTFASRNPGIIMWMSAWGYSEDQLYGEEQLFPLSDVDWPLVPEIDNTTRTTRAADTADRVAQQQSAQQQQVFDAQGTVSQSQQEQREQVSEQVIERLAGEGAVEVQRISEPGDPVTRLETPEGSLTIPRHADAVDREGSTWSRRWRVGDLHVTYSIDRSGVEARHFIRVDRS